MTKRNGVCMACGCWEDYFRLQRGWFWETDDLYSETTRDLYPHTFRPALMRALFMPKRTLSSPKCFVHCPYNSRWLDNYPAEHVHIWPHCMKWIRGDTLDIRCGTWLMASQIPYKREDMPHKSICEKSRCDTKWHDTHSITTMSSMNYCQ